MVMVFTTEKMPRRCGVASLYSSDITFNHGDGVVFNSVPQDGFVKVPSSSYLLILIVCFPIKLLPFLFKFKSRKRTHIYHLFFYLFRRNVQMRKKKKEMQPSFL
jgi:hypothetical protein